MAPCTHGLLTILAPPKLASRVRCISNLVSPPTLNPQVVLNGSHQGPINILPLRRLYIENRVQPEMLNFTSTEDVLACFNMCVSIHSSPRVLGCVDDVSILKLF
jgi:hypothetical protein